MFTILSVGTLLQQICSAEGVSFLLLKFFAYAKGDPAIKLRLCKRGSVEKGQKCDRGEIINW